MSIDIKALADNVIIQFKNAVISTVTTDSPALIAVATSYIIDEEKTLKDLVSGTLSGELAADFLIRRVNDVKEDLINSLLSIEQILASDIQTLVNKLITIFENILKAAVLSFTP